MKKYINAELQIVAVNNNDIVTASINTLNDQVGNKQQLDPGRRRSIWD